MLLRCGMGGDGGGVDLGAGDAASAVPASPAPISVQRMVADTDVLVDIGTGTGTSTGTGTGTGAEAVALFRVFGGGGARAGPNDSGSYFGRGGALTRVLTPTRDPAATATAGGCCGGYLDLPHFSSFFFFGGDLFCGEVGVGGGAEAEAEVTTTRR